MSRGSRTQARPPVWLRLVGVVGELLITLGLLIALFLVWQVWWTDIQAGRKQAEVTESLGWEAPPTQVVTDEEDPTEGDPPVIPQPGDAEVFATMYVPRFGADYSVNIAEGVDKKTILDTGFAGHYPETALPGAIGNFSLAAHRVTYAKPFNLIADLQPGDPIIVRTEETWYIYAMTESLVVMPNQVEVIAPVPGTLPGDPAPEPTERFITLTSCHPMFSARERYVAHGTLVRWMPVSQGTPAEMQPPAEGL